jgi:hypothetical protein
MKKKNDSTAGPPVQGRPTDGLDLWASEAPSQVPASLSLIRLDASEKTLVPFTTTMQRVQLHYMDAAALRGYVHCLEKDCLLCRLGKELATRDLLPVYDPYEEGERASRPWTTSSPCGR